MSPIAISLFAFVLALAGVLLGSVMQRMLPEGHLSSDSKEVVKLAIGVVATLADGVVTQQSIAATELAKRLGEIDLPDAKSRLRLLHRETQARGVEFDQGLPGLDDLPRLDLSLHHAPGGLRGDGGSVEGVHHAGDGAGAFDALLDHRGDSHAHCSAKRRALLLQLLLFQFTESEGLYLAIGWRECLAVRRELPSLAESVAEAADGLEAVPKIAQLLAQ